MPDDCWNEVGVWAAAATCPLLAQVIHCHNCEVFAGAGRGLLDQPPPAGYVAAWTRELSTTKPQTEDARVSLFVFRIGAEWLALPTGVIAEVAGMLPVRTIPHRSGALLAGMVNVRGELSLCFSMKTLLGIDVDEERQARTASQLVQPRMIVLRADDGRWVFAADEVWGIFRTSDDAMRDAPVTISRDAAAHVRGLIGWEHGDISCLDPKLLFATLQRRATTVVA
jgi:chemotaxis-related protein WspD